MKINSSTGSIATIGDILIFDVAVSEGSLANHHSGTKSYSKNIVDTAVAAGNVNSFAAALKAAGLVEALQGDGPFTVFAPTDAAFAALPEGTVEALLQPQNRDKLTAILTYHVVPGKVMAADVVGLETASTVNGADLLIEVADGSVRIGDATVVATDVMASNGVIHVIDRVMMP